MNYTAKASIYILSVFNVFISVTNVKKGNPRLYKI